jgi:Uma2 family endonuclease
MATPATLTSEPEIVYPDSDGKPMADNTRQYEWIVTIKGNLDIAYQDNPNVFVAGDLLWYPVQGHPEICQAPDVLVAFGRPKGYRGSYIQHREEGIAPQVVFEIQSPNNTAAELARKLVFYDHHGVEEYYLYDPDDNRLTGWRRVLDQLQEIPAMNGWVSPRLGIRFLLGTDLVIHHRDGRPFATFLEQAQQCGQAQQQADQAQQRAERLAAQLRALGVEPQE